MSILPASWALTSIGDVALDIIQREPEPSEKFTYIDISSIDRETKRITSPQALMGKDAPSRARKEVKAGDVLVSMTRPNLNAVAQVPEELDGQIASTGFDVLRPAIIDPRWLYYIVRSGVFIEQMTSLVQGALYPAVRSKDIHGYEIPLAPLNEQKRIADKLDVLLARVDVCRDRLGRVPQILKRFRQSVLAVATSGALTEGWREDQGEKFEWEKVRIDDLLVEKPRNGYSPKAVAFQTNTRSLTLSATTSGRFNPAHSKYINEGIPKNSYLWLAPGDILIQRANTIEYVGVSAIYDGPVESFIYPDLMMKCRPNHRVLTKYLYYILSSESVRNYFRDNATGTAGNMPKINQQTVLSAPALVPEMPEQLEIVRRVEILFAFANRLEARYTAGLEQVAQITPYLLDKAFRGELVSQDLNDEPASELLKRIKERKANEPENKRDPRTNKIQKERPMNTKAITTLVELVSVLDLLGGDAMADRLVIESGLSDDIGRFFELLREGRNTLLDVPVGSNEPIRRIVDENQ